MIEFTPVSCCTIAIPSPITKTRRIHGTASSFSSGVRTARSSWRRISSASRSACCSVRMRRSTARPSAKRPCRMSQRGLSGTTSIPKNSTTAGSEATTSIQRQTPACSGTTAARTAFTTNAASWPDTIISSLVVTMRPRRAAGASSARYIGTTTDAPPTARPSTKRAAIITPMVGANAHTAAARKNTTARAPIRPRRPRRSAMRPPRNEPRAAPKRSDDTTVPSSSGVSGRSSNCMNGSAPLMTPVS